MPKVHSAEQRLIYLARPEHIPPARLETRLFNDIQASRKVTLDGSLWTPKTLGFAPKVQKPNAPGHVDLKRRVVETVQAEK